MTAHTSAAVRKAYDAAGWHLVRETNHLIYRCPCGQHQAVISNTNQTPSAQRNAIMPIRQCNRERTIP